MSLHQLARQVQSQGRGDDKMLVHMTPGEVKGLQSLALAHGGSLSINPETGLPEAGFLKNILPTVVGAGAMFIPGMQPVGAAMLGAGVGLATSGGNLKAGIMGGLGAWGGASLAGSLMGAGAGAMGAAAAPAAELAGTEALMATGFTPTTASMAPGQVSELVSKGVLDQSAANAYGNAYSSAFPQASPGASIQAGFKEAVNKPGAFFKENMFPIGAAVLPALMGSSSSTGIGPAPDQGQIRPYTYSQKRNPNYGLPGEPYFSQSYTAGTPYAAAGGGLVALAEGGDVNKDKPVSPLTLAAPTDKYTTPRTVAPAVTAYNQILADRAANEYVTQAPPLNMLPGGGERASAGDTQKIINEMYLKNLGRQGDQAGLEYWANQKAQTGMSLADVKKAIGETPEGQVFGLYRDVLNRRPDAAGSEYWQSQLAAGVPIADIRKQFETSSEYLAKQKETPSAKKEQTGFKFDPATQRFTGGLPQPTPEVQGGFFGDITNDPNFQNYLRNQYNQFQQAQSGGGGKAGGLMPQDLKFAKGGIADLGGYSDGGRMLKGPGDGMSDSIPGVIGGRQPARLADGEFVVPADVVSHLGNGSTDAGAKKLYSMMDRVRKARTGKKKQAPQVKTERLLPA